MLMTTENPTATPDRANAALRILLVEDSPRLLERLRELIDDIEGVRVIGTADTQQDAVEQARRHQPDVLLLDLQLKQGTGFEVIRQLRGNDIHVITIIMTNYALPEYRRLANELGAEHFLDKTSEFDQLPTLLRQIRLARAAKASGNDSSTDH